MESISTKLGRADAEGLVADLKGIGMYACISGCAAHGYSVLVRESDARMLNKVADGMAILYPSPAGESR